MPGIKAEIKMEPKVELWTPRGGKKPIGKRILLPGEVGGGT